MNVFEVALYKAFLSPVVALPFLLVLAGGVYATRWLPERLRAIALWGVPPAVCILAWLGMVLSIAIWG